MVSLAEQRRGAEHLEAQHGVSERRACQVVGIARSTKRRPSGRIEEAKLVRRVHELTQRYPRFGYRKIHAVLRSEGTAIGRDRLRLIRKREGLQVARKQRKRRRAGKSTTDVDRALYPNHVWSYDFVADQTIDGRRLRFLTVIDEFTREAIWIEAARLVVESWRREYDEERPHGALNQPTPAAYAAGVGQQRREAA